MKDKVALVDDVRRVIRASIGNSKTKNINAAIYRQLPEAKVKGRTGICHTGAVHMDVHAVPVCQFRQRTDFIGPVDSAQLRTLRDIKSSRLGMMLLAEMTKIRTYQLRSQLSVGSGNRTNLTACHAGRSAAFIYINMRSFRTYYRIIRTRA